MTERSKVDEWNRRHPQTGVAVTLRKPNGVMVSARTRTMAAMMGATAVVWLDQMDGPCPLSRVSCQEKTCGDFR